jgi:hypothetical protein
MTVNNRRSRRWVFTLNNPGDGGAEDPQTWPGVKYLCWQLEAAETGTLHLQGLVIFINPKTLGGCRLINGRCHWEIMRGTLAQAEKYCSKEDTRVLGPWRRGVKPQPGKRNDIWDIKAMIDQGHSEKAIADAHFATWAKFHRAFSRYRLLSIKQRNARPTIFILWGASGLGKTRVVREAFSEAYWKPRSKWWDGYENQEVVIFDEFYSWIPLAELLKILDWYPMQVETKGGSVQLTTSCFVFTSNVNPLEWYSNMSHTRVSALHRRFEQFGTIYKFNESLY